MAREDNHLRDGDDMHTLAFGVGDWAIKQCDTSSRLAYEVEDIKSAKDQNQE